MLGPTGWPPSRPRRQCDRPHPRDWKARWELGSAVPDLARRSGAAALPPGFTAFDRAVLPITLAALTALAALARIGAALLADLYDPLLTLAAAAWIGAFAAFLAVCGPMLLAPRPAREPDYTKQS